MAVEAEQVNFIGTHRQYLSLTNTLNKLIAANKEQQNKEENHIKTKQMKNYLTHMVKKSKWCIIVTVLVILLLTFGLPHLSGGEITWHTVREIESPKERFGAILLLVAIVVMSWLQVYNEYSRPRK